MSTNVFCTKFLLRLALFLPVLWLWKALALFTLPFLFTANFLLAVLFVFIFGIKTLTTLFAGAFYEKTPSTRATAQGPYKYTFPALLSRGAHPKATVRKLRVLA